MARSIAVALCGITLVASMLPAVAREPVRRGRSRTVNASAATSTASQTAELFAAEADGLVAVKYIPNDSRSAQVIITNRTPKPLSLRLPAAFAGVPVLAQMGMGGGGAAAGFGAGGIGGGVEWPGQFSGTSLAATSLPLPAQPASVTRPMALPPARA